MKCSKMPSDPFDLECGAFQYKPYPYVTYYPVTKLVFDPYKNCIGTGKYENGILKITPR